MRAVYVVDGLVNDFNEGKMCQPEKLQVNVTQDKIGCTLSIGSEKTGIQYTIPFDYILRELKKGGR